MKKNRMKQKLVSILLILVLAGTIPLLTAFSNKEPETLYRVYLKGESIGLIKSKEALEDYIDKRQNQIIGEYSEAYVLKENDVCQKPKPKVDLTW